MHEHRIGFRGKGGRTVAAADVDARLICRIGARPCDQARVDVDRLDVPARTDHMTNERGEVAGAAAYVHDAVAGTDFGK